MQLLHLDAGGWTPLHFRILSSIKASNEICLIFSTNSEPKQFTHFPLGGWLQFFFFRLFSLSDAGMQFKHDPPIPWLHFDLSILFLSSSFPLTSGTRQLTHL